MITFSSDPPAQAGPGNLGPRFTPQRAALETMAMSLWGNAAGARLELDRGDAKRFKDHLATIAEIQIRAESAGRDTLAVAAHTTAKALRVKNARAQARAPDRDGPANSQKILPALSRAWPASAPDDNHPNGAM